LANNIAISKAETIDFFPKGAEIIAEASFDTVLSAICVVEESQLPHPLSCIRLVPSGTTTPFAPLMGVPRVIIRDPCKDGQDVADSWIIARGFERIEAPDELTVTFMGSP